MDNGKLHRSNNFGKLPAEIIHDVTITDGAARQYAHMHWRYGSNGDNHESQKSMADMLGVAEKTISNRCDELAAHDWIIIMEFQTEDNFQAHFYHVFERQEDCRHFRETYTPTDFRERMLPKPEGRSRKSRKGAGNPSPNHQNSSSDARQNSSSDNPDSVDPDPKELKDYAPKNGAAQPKPKSSDVAKQPTPFAMAKSAMCKAFSWDETAMPKASHGIVGKAVKQLMDAGYTDKDIPPLYSWCKAQNWPSMSPMALVTHAQEWKATLQKSTSILAGLTFVGENNHA